MDFTIRKRSIFDITPLINSRLAVFPGDTPFQQEFLLRTEKGHNITLSKITSTVHLGAHTDAPNHYGLDKTGIEARSLDYYLGPAQVIEVKKPRGQRIQVEDLKGRQILAPRLLFKTLSFPDPYQWNSDFNSLSGPLVDFLAAQGVRLVGLDTPSIDLAEDKVLESHLRVHHHDMAILEGIVLQQVPEGLYELIALPLKIEGADATPVRAILRELQE
jgi:arylformamidase